MAEHTPGPWHSETSEYTASDGVYECWAVCADGGGDVAIVTVQRDHDSLTGDAIPDAEAEANARLIAAAPDMLKALRQITANIHPNYNPLELAHGMDLARAAIAKATGDEVTA